MNDCLYEFFTCFKSCFCIYPERQDGPLIGWEMSSVKVISTNSVNNRFNKEGFKTVESGYKLSYILPSTQ